MTQLFFELNAEELPLSAHQEFAGTQGHWAPVTEVFLTFWISSKDISFGEKFKAFWRRINEAENSVFAILNDQGAIGIEACSTAHEGIVSSAP